MPDHRIEKHPILNVPDRETVSFYWQGHAYSACQGDTIASALFANGIHIFGHHHKDGAPQGIFCANGQCAQCMVIADGLPLKSCAELVTPGMRVEPADGLPALPNTHYRPRRTGHPPAGSARSHHWWRPGRAFSCD